ncbi:MAG: hypothetical protein ACJASM_003047 [Salibacteraceae bacterium]|jgi:hypothetical protein
MTKKILLTLSIFCFIGATVFGQAIEGGAGVIHVNGNPNLMLTMDDLSVNEGHVAYDRTTGTAYFFDPAGVNFATNSPSVGTQWIGVSISDLVDPITSIIVSPGDDELTASTPDVNGVVTLSFESDATISYAPATSILTFTDLDGDMTNIDISGGTVVQADDPSVTVAGAGTTASPYLVSLTGASVAGNAGGVPVTDGAGNLTWTNVVEDVTVSSDGQVMLTFTDSATPVAIDMSNIPEAANITELNGFATALGVGETGLVRASDDNTFGMPATSTVGVLFFISN